MQQDHKVLKEHKVLILELKVRQDLKVDKGHKERKV